MTASHDLPAGLQHAVEAARRALAEGTRGDVPRPLRRRIDAAFGPRTRGPDGGSTGAGYRRRVALERQAVRRVLPIWAARHPDDARPRQMIELAERLVNGTIAREVAEREMADFLADVEDASYADVPAVGFAGAAAATLVRTAMYDRDPEAATAERQDDDLDPDMHETDYLVSRAAAYDEPRITFEQHPAVVERRLRPFWQWYLDDAVPAAFASTR